MGRVSYTQHRISATLCIYVKILSMTSPKHKRAEVAFAKMRLEAIESHVAKIARFKGNVRPFDYPRIEADCVEILREIHLVKGALLAKVRKAHLKKVIK